MLRSGSVSVLGTGGRGFESCRSENGIMFFKTFFVYSDSPEFWQKTFQDPATGIMEELIRLHHLTFYFIIMTFIFIVYMILRMVQLFHEFKQPSPNKKAITEQDMMIIEALWTTIPCVILIIIGINSFTLLNTMDEIRHDYGLTIKVVGYQWYWGYEYKHRGDQIAFISRMLPESSLKPGQFRLLEVDRRMVVPIETPVRLLITAQDVIHSWAVPSLGIKLDATPGRINATGFYIKREGVYYGQCSELCGINHAFMPIVVEAVMLDKFVRWLDDAIILSVKLWKKSGETEFLENTMLRFE